MKARKKTGYAWAGIGIIAAAGALAVMLPGGSPAPQASPAELQRSAAAVEAYMNGKDGSSQYGHVLRSWTEAKLAAPERPAGISLKRVGGGQVYGSAESEGYGGDVIYAAPKDKVAYEAEVPEEGLYEIWLDDFILARSALNPELSVEVNGEKPYNEMNEIKLPVDWKVREGDKKVDRYGDELVPGSEIDSAWRSEGLRDPNFFFAEPLKFHLKKGRNAVEITINEGHLLIGKAELKNTATAVQPYQDYRASKPGAPSGEVQSVTIEAEDMARKSRPSIRAKYVRDAAVTPYSYKNRVLNVLDGYSFGESGDKVSYRFEAKESGFYRLTFKYSQDTNNGMPSHRKIELDGNVPFRELSSYSFPYSSGWKNETLQDEHGTPYEIYLEKGMHSLTLSNDNSSVRDIYHELLETAEMMDAASQQVNRLTGGLVDRERKWNLEKYIPEISAYLLGIAAKIEEQKRALAEQTGKEDLPALSQLEVAAQMVREFVDDPNELPHYMGKFVGDQTSAYGRIKSVLPMLVYSPLHLDKIYVGSGGELPKPEAGIVKSSVENVKSFFYSFANPRYGSAGAVDGQTVQVWVNQSRLYVELMQRMIDEEFTPATGIKVNLSILPDENKLVLSNAAGSTPDAAMGVSFGKPFELAIRGIIEDLRPYDGFYKLAEEYNPGAFIPFIYDKGVYAFPETQDVKLLFYRKDLMKFLGEEPPQTWEDVASLVPMLQKYDMNFYTPLGSNNSFKGFDTTTPFLYQFGGRLYDDTGSKTAINASGAYEGFEFMTDLFTVYNVPITTSEFYQSFRNGKTPVGIGDANTYIQLKYAAPELAGQWAVLPIPGVRNEQGVVERWDPTYGSSSIIFKSSEKKESAWKFIQWWASADTQSAFSYNIKSTLGEKFLYMTANLKGFADSAWPSDSKEAILEQWKWIQTTGKVPGDYVLEREISNAWNAVVFNKQNPRTALDNAVKTINREFDRKLQEFGYVKDGKLIKPYRVPTIDNVGNWVKDDGK